MAEALTMAADALTAESLSHVEDKPGGRGAMGYRYREQTAARLK